MSFDLNKCRAVLPMPNLMNRIGMEKYAKPSTRCPWHDDKNPSFGIFFANELGRWKWKCHSQCGTGDEVDLLERHFGVPKSEAIRRYAELAGVQPGSTTGIARDAEEIFGGVAVQGEASPSTEPEPGPEPAQVIEPLSQVALEQLSKSRGISVETLSALAERDELAVAIDREGKRCIAFAVEDGWHYRKAGDGWRYTAGAKPNLFNAGEIEEGAGVHCFESQWDALAFIDKFPGNWPNTIATRGAGNVRLLTNKLKGHTGVLYLWPQHDEPGQKWARDIRAALTDQQIMLVTTSTLWKDLNEWVKDGGADRDDINAVFLGAKDFPVPVLAETIIAPESCENVEARESNPEGDRAAGEGPDYSGGGNNLAVILAEKSDQQECIPGGQNNLGSEKQPGKPGSADAKDGVNCAIVSPDNAPPALLSGDGEEGHMENAGRNEARVQPGPSRQLSEILTQVSQFLKRFVVFPYDEHADAIALWVAHSWVFPVFRFTPYLNICSPEKRCGKTRLMECLYLVVPNPVGMVRPTEAVLFRTIHAEKPTLMLDEIDTVYTSDADSNSEGVRAVLNAGFQSGPMAIVRRCVGRNHEPEAFDTFCPKVIAGIGKNLPDTVRDRSIEIRLVRQLSDDKAERFRAVEVEGQIRPLRDSLEAWSKQVGPDLAQARPSIPSQLTDRQQDMCEPLLAIADTAGQEWAELGRESLIALSAKHEDVSVGVRLLADCREIFSAKQQPKLTTKELLEALIKIESAESPWPSWWENDIRRDNVRGPGSKLAKLLGHFEIKPSNIRTTGSLGETAVVKGYLRCDFEDAWSRYLEPVKGLVTKEFNFDL